MGCAYNFKKLRGNKVKIYPLLASDCGELITVGLGNATFSFDPKRPPDVVKRIITGDAGGMYTTPVEFGSKRHTKTFKGVEKKVKEITTANGDVIEIGYTELKGYEEKGSANPKHVLSGMNNIGFHSKVM